MRHKRSKRKEIVYFKGDRLLLDTVRSYASDPDNPHHQEAKKFLDARQEKGERYYNEKQSFTDKIMEQYERESRLAWPEYTDSVISVPNRFFKEIARDLSAKVDNPSTAFSKGFNLFANPKPESKEKIKKEMGQFFKKIFKKDIKEGEEKKMADSLVKSKSTAMEHLAEASKEISKEIGRYGISTMSGIMGAALSVSGKALAGGLFALPLLTNEVWVNILDLNKLDRYSDFVKAKMNERELEFVVKKAKEPDSKDFIDMLYKGVYGPPSKDEVKALSQFVDKDGVFDQKGYEKEMAKALDEIKDRAKKQVEKLNKELEEEKTSKKASRLVKRYFLKKASEGHRLY